MAPFLHSIRRHAAWAGLAGVMVPLLVLLILQFRSLSTLKRTWALAHRTSLESCLAEVSVLMEQELGARAERLLRVPAASFEPDQAHLAIRQLTSQPREGFRDIFLYKYQAGSKGTLLRFSLKEGALVPAEKSAGAEAATMAAAPWALFNEKAIPLESAQVSVDERDSEHRLIQVPITNVASQLVGMASAELDEDFMAKTILPQVIPKALASYFAEDIRANLVVSVRKPGGELVYATEDVEGQRDEVSAPLIFAFKSWRVGIRSRDFTPEQFASSNFTINAALSFVLGFVLVGGVALALRTASRELKLSQMKSDFVSNVSHELKTPLASIRLFGELMRLGRVTSEDKVKEYGAFIDAESRRLTQLITNILDSSRIESGRKVYARDEVELGELVSEGLKSFEVICRHQGYQVKLQPPAERVTVTGDWSSLAQVVHNLVDNAIKYSPAGSTIDLSLDRHLGQARLRVRDQGIGIDSSEQEKIFERFHRVSTGLLHEVRGSGLGLSIVKHVVEAHGGRIDLESAPGKGSTFTLWLPLSKQAAPEEEDEGADEAPGTARAAGGEP